MKLNFLCCCDTHDVALPGIAAEGTSAWLHAGDVYSGANAEALDTYGSTDPSLRQWAEDRCRAMANWLARCPLPVYAVGGNHDVDDPWGFFADGRDVTGRVVEVAPHLFLAGIGWHGMTASDLPGEGELQRVCKGVWRQAYRMLRKADRLLILTHYQIRAPELPCFPGSAYGFDCIRELVDEFHPLAVVQGHVHEAFGCQDRLAWEGGETLVVNPGPRGGILSVDVEGNLAEYVTGR
jgi:Icc-related predicted phosphoesterase